MTSKIKELANKAGYNDQIFEISKEGLEKLVKLAVLDCMAMCDELKGQYLSFRKNTMDFDEKHIYAEGEAACDTLKYKMKNQFGVGE